MAPGGRVGRPLSGGRRAIHSLGCKAFNVTAIEQANACGRALSGQFPEAFIPPDALGSDIQESGSFGGEEFCGGPIVHGSTIVKPSRFVPVFGLVRPYSALFGFASGADGSPGFTKDCFNRRISEPEIR